VIAVGGPEVHLFSFHFALFLVAGPFFLLCLPCLSQYELLVVIFGSKLIWLFLLMRGVLYAYLVFVVSSEWFKIADRLHMYAPARTPSFL